MRPRDLSRFYFTKSSLDIYKMCKLRFRRIYIDSFYWGSRNVDNEELKEMMKRGQDFHLLAQRYFLGIPSDAGENYDGKLSDWMENLKDFMKGIKGMSFPEYELRFFDGRKRIKAKYDLLVIDDKGITIYDWKTDSKRPNAGYYDRCSQTVVYMYTALKSGRKLTGRAMEPENIKMVYWNPSYPEDAVHISYDGKRLGRDEEILDTTVEGILKSPYEGFTPVEDREKCRYCEFNYLCNNEPVDYLKVHSGEIEDIDIDEIMEIEI